MSKLFFTSVALSAMALFGACGTDASVMSVADDLRYCDNQLSRTLDEMRDSEGDINYGKFPRNILRGEEHWNLRNVSQKEWCSGFFPGILWYDYEATGNEQVLQEARNFTDNLSFLAQTPAYDHDLGFLVITSFLNGYRLTGDEAYKKVILACADTLATLFNEKAGTILSWPRHVKDYGAHNTIMDNMINLELLFWASANGGNPDLARIARSHADMTMQHQFHDGYANYHVALYDTLDGHFLRGITHQGLADETMWARGQAWAIYGFTMCYKYSGDKRYLDFAQHCADHYLDRLPADGVPYWDFDDPRILTSKLDSFEASETQAPRDASAACVVTSALFDLAQFSDNEKACKYVDAANKTLATLHRTEWRGGDHCPAFLLHSTGHHPNGSEIDASISYADYYYIESLIKAKRLAEHETKTLAERK